MTSSIILVIDDDRSVHEIVEAALSIAGIECIFAITAEAGINLTREHHPQLILMDLLLPHGTKGPEAIAIIKSDDATAHIPILAFTAAPGDLIKQAMHAGVDDVITKPFSMKHLQHTVKHYLSMVH